VQHHYSQLQAAVCMLTEVTHRNRHRRPAACCATRIAQLRLPAVVFCCRVCASCQDSRQVQPGLFDRLDTSQQIHRCLLICLASRVGHAGRMLLSSAICRLLCLLLCTGFVQHVTAARQVQPGLFDRLDISTDTQMSTDMPCISWHGRMLLSSAICRLLCLLLCTGFVQHVTAARQVQPGLFDRLDTSQQMHRCLLVCLESVQVVQSGCLLLSAGCCAVAACTGFVQHVNTAVTGCKVCFTDPTHQNNRAREL
jgi:hypothetical protein